MSFKPTAISARNLGKSYTILHNAARATSFREAIVHRLRHPMGESRQESETFWALRDVNFDVAQGEIVGIIGRNGAGKSTLLKILSRIATPSTGTLDIHGRMASLLEVGTGFHPELTGRENIFLNGSILGMSRRDIARNFDAIVAFAEVEKFLDTPVKRYSSGMYVRLAFSVAAHLEPEILIVDEVLAVGDTAFQKKCLGKMQDVSGQGRTILFVSHSMTAVTRLCPRAILMEGGRLVADGPSHEVTAAYLQTGKGMSSARDWFDDERPPGGDVVRLRSARVRAEDDSARESFDIRRPIGLEMEYDVLERGYNLIPNFALYNEEGGLLFITHDTDPDWRGRERPPGRYTSTAWIPGNLLSEGHFTVDVAVSRHAPVEPLAHFQAAVAFQVVDSTDGDTARGDYAGHLPGAFRPLLKWTNDFSASAPRAEADVPADLLLNH